MGKIASQTLPQTKKLIQAAGKSALLSLLERRQIWRIRLVACTSANSYRRQRTAV